MQRRWPYPVTLQGAVDGQKASVKTKMSINGSMIGREATTLQTGASTVTGDAAIVQQAPRNKLTFRFATPSFALSDLPPAGAAARAVAAAHTAAATHGAGDEPVPIALLRSIDAEGEISIGELALANGSGLRDLPCRSCPGRPPDVLRCRRRYRRSVSPIFRSMPLAKRRPDWRCTRR